MGPMCYRCESSELIARGLFVGCRDCGLWTEYKQYALLQLKQIVVRMREGRSTTTASSAETCLSASSLRS